MKHISSAIAAGLLVLGSAAVAAAQSAQPSAPQARAEHSGKARQRGPGRHGEQALFRDMKLSDNEKASLKNIREKYAPQLKALRPDFKAQGKIAKGDRAALRKRWQENAPKREQAKQLMLAERSEIRGALTAENQAKFDANVQKMQERIAKRGERAKAHAKAPRSRTPGQN